jgi:excisionase family DNA binding protein
MVANNDELLTRKEAAEVLRSALRTVDGLIAKGDLPAVRIGKSVRIRRTSIAYLIEARESRGPAKKKGGKA